MDRSIRVKRSLLRYATNCKSTYGKSRSLEVSTPNESEHLDESRYLRHATELWLTGATATLDESQPLATCK
jgi:hypothetical protein